MKNDINRWSKVSRSFILPALLLTLAVNTISAQTYPSLEFASGGASTSATGPTLSNQTITLQRNNNNPTGNTFTTQTPAKTVTFSLTNQQTTSASSPGVGVMFGGGNSATTAGAAAYAIYAPLNNLGGANDTHFRSLGGSATAGSEGISATSNYGVVVYTTTRPFYESNAPLPANGSSVIYQTADLVLTFNSPVSNPILHFSGLGGVVQNTSTPISSELVMLSPGLTLTRLSGSPEFSVPSATEIRNSAPSFFPTTGSGAASGSVQVNGANITSITFRLYLKAQGQGTIAWSASSTDNRGDGFTVSVSLNACNSGATPTVQNISNTCPANTADLGTAHTGTTPSGSSLVWYTTSTRNAGTEVTGSGITAAGSGTYYAFYYDSTNNCYSSASDAVTVTINSCSGPSCTNSGNSSVNLNSLYTGTHPNAPNTVLEWWTSPTRNLAPNTTGTKVLNPTSVGLSGTYYAFFYDTAGNCYNTDNSTAAVTVTILSPCPCIISVTNPDSDGDGIADDCDLDDDNDGILDTDEAFCDQTTAPNGVFPASNNTDNIYQKQLLFFDWSGVTLTNASPTASRSVVFNGVTYTATVSGYNSSGNFSMVGSDINTSTGLAHWIKNYYDVNGDTFKEILFNTASQITNNRLNIQITATKGSVTYPVEVVVFDPEATNSLNSGEDLIYNTTGSNFTLLQKTETGTIDSNSITGGGTSTLSYINTSSTNVNALYTTSGYNPTIGVRLRMILTSGSKQGVGIAVRLACDTDGDGIPNRLDLDSDNDGCSDAIEGASTTITNLNLVNSSMPGGNSGATSGTYNQPVIQNLGNAVNTTSGSASYGVPTIAGSGQAIGTSQNTLVNSCFCYEDPALVAGATYPVKHGITILGRAGKVSTGTANTTSDWPMMRNSAYTALESKTKGLVITRNSSPETTIAIPVVGMMVFDTNENAGAGCMKIYTGSGAGEGWKCFNTQTCP